MDKVIANRIIDNGIQILEDIRLLINAEIAKPKTQDVAPSHNNTVVITENAHSVYKQAGLYTFNDIQTLTGLSRSTIWRWIKDKKFPAQVKLGGTKVAWRAEDINAWLDNPESWTQE